MRRKPGQPLTDLQRVTMLAAYTRGEKQISAAAEANVSPGTVNRYFQRWRAEGRQRSPRAPKRAPQTHSLHGPPRYTGPDWIGERIAPPLDADSRM